MKLSGQVPEAKVWRRQRRKKTSLGRDASCDRVLAEILMDLNALDLKMSAKNSSRP